jgi:ribosomal protein S18 acetylase RimI-like enzyme
MSYQSILASSELPEVIPRSERESDRFGLELGRVELGPDADVGVDELIGLVERSALDVIVVRHPAAWTDFPARLAVPSRRTHQADTLMYYRAALEAPLPSRVELPDEVSIRALEPRDGALLEQAVRATFAGYQSHYRTNPLFSPADILEGYVDWALRAAFDAGDTSANVVCDSEGLVQGFVVMSEGEFPELLLTGVLEGARGRGIYTAMIRAACERISRLGGSALYASTQAHNLGSQRTWIGLGFRLELVLSTVHLTRSNLVAPW